VIDSREGQREALKRVAGALARGGVRFALAGGYAVWAHGGPEPEHDVDVAVRPEDAAAAADALRDAGLRVEQPPEDWLFKVYSDGAMVDVLLQINGRDVDAAMLARAHDIEVLSVVMPVSDMTDVLVGKLCALNEQRCDLNKVLPAARAVREQVDWARTAQEIAGYDVALACLFLLRRLGVAPAGDEIDEVLRLPGS
jgi:hypothetical protein